MIILPGTPAVQETRHSRELSRRIDQLVREYQRDNPDTSLSDVRIALMQRTPGGDSPVEMKRRRIVGVVAGALLAGGFAAMAASGGGSFESNTMTWRIIGVVAALLGVTIAVIRTVRRS